MQKNHALHSMIVLAHWIYILEHLLLQLIAAFLLPWNGVHTEGVYLVAILFEDSFYTVGTGHIVNF